MARARFAEILRLLASGDVEFVVVGMTAGILHGAPPRSKRPAGELPLILITGSGDRDHAVGAERSDVGG
jgi:hypothetical protein